MTTEPLHLISVNCRYSHSCLALFYLRNALEAQLPEVSVRLSQFTINDPYYATLQRISTIPARAVFFSVYIWNHHRISRLLADLTRLLPGLPLIIGGPQAPALHNLPEQCVLVLGEVEGLDERFYEDLRVGQLQAEYRGGQSHSFPSPYRAEDFSGPLKNRQLYYESSRGCPFFCSYCLSSVSRGIRHKTLSLVKQELRQLIAAEPMIIKLVDRTFNDDPERAIAIWNFLRQEAAEVRFHFEIAPDRFTEPMFALLSTIACDQFQFEIGIQSCNPETLAAVNRRMDLEQAEENIQRLLAFDTIHLHLDLILGLPFETAASFRESFNRVFYFAPHYIQLGLLKVLPNTELAERAEEFGLVFCKEPPYEVLANRWLSRTELHELYEFCECVESFYNNRFFRSLWQYLLRTGEEPFAFFADLLALCRKEHFFQLARTQKLMNRILFELVSSRPDSALLRELLCYDWLRCGHRTLPTGLPGTASMTQAEYRSRLRSELPQNLAGVFDYRSRVEFIKQSSFVELSKEAMAMVGLGNAAGLVALVPEQGGGVMKFNRPQVLRC
jgi:radical SAM superfamily enzyme YgiQ (UPF0313 family)